MPRQVGVEAYFLSIRIMPLLNSFSDDRPAVGDLLQFLSAHRLLPLAGALAERGLINAGVAALADRVIPPKKASRFFRTDFRGAPSAFKAVRGRCWGGGDQGRANCCRCICCADSCRRRAGHTA